MNFIDDKMQDLIIGLMIRYEFAINMLRCLAI
jgi:hypothetical protein